MFVKVIVDIPAAQVNRPFDYQVPEAYQDSLQLGMRVQVPFGNRQLLGFVVGIHHTSDFKGTLKPITAVLDYESFINEELLDLSEHLAQTLHAFRINVLQAMLPAMLKVKYQNIFLIHQPQGLSDYELPSDWLNQSQLDKDQVEAQLSRKQIKQLLDQGVLELVYQVQDQTTTKTQTMIELAMPAESIKQIIQDLPARSQKVAQLLTYLLASGQPQWEQQALLAASQVSASSLKTALKHGYIKSQKVSVYRDPLAHLEVEQSQSRTLTEAQKAVYEQVAQALEAHQDQTFLLEGVTGSGKTEVYLQLMAKASQMGRGAILLVPEIALTPQMVRQVKSRFQTGVAVLHSGLTNSQKYDEWRRIIRGQATIVVGARSSIFAPIRDLGLVIIDEEHETTYKQSDTPRYHAREVAIWRCHYHQAPLLLGSATPSLESRSRAQVGRYQHLRLPERVNGRPLPPVTLVDMTKEMAQQTTDELSSVLKDKITDRLAKGQQIVLLLNRRGYASYMLCRECGQVIQCPRCDISLTYHKHEHRLKCHYCDYQSPVPDRCPNCHSDYLRTFGLGTQKIEELLNQHFPDARVIRMDMDTTRKKGQHEALLDRFRRHEADILLGTQMIAKGLDFEAVTLVGVINADTALNLPDFRAGEKTFQLLTQVAGRTGRGRFEGEVLIQTYNPDHYVMQLAQQHDYESFFYYEMKRRHLGHYPPYFYTTLITISSKYQAKAQAMSHQVKQALLASGAALEILGPSQGAIARINERYYFQLLLKYKDGQVIKESLGAILDQSQLEAKQGIYITIDHEPLFFN
ncbi:primosomal protein N' [Abiotrophia defectiva]|uniref:Replication restart protein PriA n=1 Tax=Abiotrophia defectiva ATCC 49176 TaxID=592010 RepID=W1Q5A0_ABIDE|nr:primosomal protein N' [Abiotrophia defectiva]ESK66435.1 primosomal protein [Abiotrophia defectiva ATCC 49176]QKH46148.1 primosomal protein N' [Abiotrophia defectiva]